MYPVYRETFERELDNVSVDEDSFVKYFLAIAGTKRSYEKGCHYFLAPSTKRENSRS